jgi:hypothetical protein
MAVADPIWPQLILQHDALQTILPGDIYSTSLGLSVHWLPPTEQDPPPQIYLDRIDIEVSAGGDMITASATWVALVVDEPSQVIEAALQAQAEMVRSLRGLCGVRVTRAAPTARAVGSNTLIVPVTASITLAELQADDD